jgi:hypothetical protein
MKVQFVGQEKVILVNPGETELDVRKDIYSPWKKWLQDFHNTGFLPALRTIGGEEIGTGTNISPYFFLLNGWRIRPFEGDHQLVIQGNLFVDGGGNPFLPTIGSHNVYITSQTSANAVTVETNKGMLTAEQHKSLMETIPEKIATLDSIVQDVVDRTDEVAIDVELIEGKLGEVKNQTFALPTDPASQNQIATSLSEMERRLRGIDQDTLKTIADKIESQSAGGLTSEQNEKLMVDIPTRIASVKSDTDGIVSRVSEVKNNTINIEHKLDTQASIIGTVKARTDRLPTDPASQVKTDTAIIDSENRLKNELSGKVEETLATVKFLESVERGAWKIVANQMVFYMPDNTTEIMRFNLLDDKGRPTMTEYFERVAL